MNPENLPSKKFLTIGGIAIFLLAVVLIVQTEWFKNIFKPKEGPNNPIMIGEAITKDSNGNGIPDWEEALWGLDPKVLYTGEMSNKEIIENKKKGLNLNKDYKNTESRKLAVDLISTAMSLGQENVSLQDIGLVGEEMANNTDIENIPNKYNKQNVKIVKTTSASIKKYKESQESILNKYPEDQSSLIIVSVIESGDITQLKALEEYSIQYKQILSELEKLEAPLGIAQEHIDILNSIYGLSEAFKYLSDIENDAVRAINGIGIYKKYTTIFEAATNSYATFLKDYDII